LLTHEQQAATQDSTTGSGTQVTYNNWVLARQEAATQRRN